jgi:hypothetical protein
MKSNQRRVAVDSRSSGELRERIERTGARQWIAHRIL